jgi:hypothetical protein
VTRRTRGHDRGTDEIPEALLVDDDLTTPHADLPRPVRDDAQTVLSHSAVAADPRILALASETFEATQRIEKHAKRSADADEAFGKLAQRAFDWCASWGVWLRSIALGCSTGLAFLLVVAAGYAALRWLLGV